MQCEPRKGQNVCARDGRAGNHFLLPVQPMPSNRTFFSDENVLSSLPSVIAVGHMWLLSMQHVVNMIEEIKFQFI